MARLMPHRAGHQAVALVLAATTITGCEKSPFESDRPVPTAVEPSPSSAASALPTVDAGFAIERPDPLPPAGDLKEDAEHFTSLDACVAQHAVLDPVVGDAVRSIGYDTLLRDACRVLQAIKLKDASPCTAITSSVLEERCEALVAMATQAPDKCPWYAPGEKELGRDPMCLAIATHDPRICAAGHSASVATCEALASGDGARCQKATSDEVATCPRDFARQHTLFAGERDAHDTTRPKARVEIRGADGGKDPSTTDLDFSPSVTGGAVLSSAASDGIHIELARDLETTLKLAARGDKPHLSAGIVLGSSGPTVSALSITIPKLPELTCDRDTRCAMTVTVPKADPKRGSPLSVTIEGRMQTHDGDAYQVKLQIDTFVRDVVARAAVYGGR